jgi:hypothetical protein
MGIKRLFYLYDSFFFFSGLYLYKLKSTPKSLPALSLRQAGPRRKVFNGTVM